MPKGEGSLKSLNHRHNSIHLPDTQTGEPKTKGEQEEKPSQESPEGDLNSGEGLISPGEF